MNRAARVIVVLVTVGVGIAYALASSLPASPIYTDDVYYWPDDDPQPQQEAANAETVSVTSTQATEPSPRVIFLDDSITRQNPDTVVRVRIKR